MQRRGTHRELVWIFPLTRTADGAGGFTRAYDPLVYTQCYARIRPRSQSTATSTRDADREGIRGTHVIYLDDGAVIERDYRIAMKDGSPTSGDVYHVNAVVEDSDGSVHAIAEQMQWGS